MRSRAIELVMSERPDRRFNHALRAEAMLLDLKIPPIRQAKSVPLAPRSGGRG